MKRKYAMCGYGSFQSSNLGLRLKAGQVFAVTEKIENSPEYQEGLRTKNFIPVEVTTITQLKQVVGVTDEMVAEFSGEPVAKKPQKAEAPKKPEVEEVIPVEADEPEKDTVDVDALNYRELQTYALDLEGKFGVEINRSAKKADLLKEVKAVLKKHGE